MNTSSIFGDLSVKDFLANYWQKKPLVIRNAFPDYEMPFTAEELAGLAIDTDAPSRIIIENGLAPKHQPWQVKLSPFEDEDFTTLPDSHCTFLVNDLERYIPELGNLMEPFRFIPDWRIDDLMVSYAEDQGSVGPHNDEYDVFLIQGEGKRRWKVITRENYDKTLIPDLDIALLKEFEADEEWLLETGDMLYLPPNMPHFGRAEGPCFTFSVGFRAPQTLELTQSWLETFSQQSGFKERFSDANRSLQKNSGEISQKDIQTLSQMMQSALQKEQQNLPLFLGKYLTEARGETPEINEPDSSQVFHKETDYERESWLRLAYIEDNNILHFFADGQHVELPLKLKQDIQELCENYYFTSESLKPLTKNAAFKKLFTQLIQQGAIHP